MKIGFRFPIAVKLSIVSIVILLMAMLPTALKTSDIFKNVSGKREEDSNRAQADARANQVSVISENLADKLSFFGALMMKEHMAKSAPDSKERILLQQTFDNDSDFVSLELFEQVGGIEKSLEKLASNSFLDGYKLESTYFVTLDKRRPFPIKKVFSGESVIRNRSVPKGAPILSMGVPISKDAKGQVNFVAVANVRLDTLQKAFSDSGERQVFLVDGQGYVFAHPEEKLAMSVEKLDNLDIVKKAISSKLAKGQLRYQKKPSKDYFIAAFSKAPFGLSVISEAPEALILEPAVYVQRQVYFITGLVLSGALFVIFLFSLTITRPIEKLVLITREIAKGNFNIPVARLITSNDEVGTLAVSFDVMLGGLRERDKVKTLLNKFHGSSVAESLLASDQVGTGGVRRKVVVFFSDIRGFTALSESSSPEAVVNMVNEYFTQMVNVILKNHGIVDKFIGDAIMAIWGAPKSTGQDEYYAVKACLEMRMALSELNEKRKARNEPPLLIGMGLHTGEAISGTIGSEERMEFTVIGDTVNMASRIEASTKAFGSDLLVSEDVMAAAKDRFIFEDAGAVKVKGKAKPFKLLKVRGLIKEGGEKQIIKTPYSDYKAEGADKVDKVD